MTASQRRWRPPRLVVVLAPIVVIAVVAAFVIGTHLVPSRRAPAGSTLPPDARMGAAVAYDEARRQVVLFGGQSRSSSPLDETWTWDGQRWSEARAAARPAPRTGALTAYDAPRNVVVMFGGTGKGPSTRSAPVDLTDTWTWDGSRWTQQHPAHTPSLGGGGWPSTMASDPSSKSILLFGFVMSSSGSINENVAETWSWNGSDWTKLAAATGPQTPATMFSDGHHAFLIGQPFWPVNGRTVYQIWRWDGDAWTLMTFQRDLPATAGIGGIAFDQQHGALVLLNADTWTWDGSGWWRQHPATHPTTVGYMVYFAALHEVVSWGDQYGSPDNAMWKWDGTTWSLLQAGTVTPPTPSPTEGKGVVEAGPMSPVDATALIRKTVTTESPVLMPGWLPAGLEATVSAGADGFTVRYLSDQREIDINWGILVPNPPPAPPNAGGGPVQFRGVTAEYMVSDKTATYSSRWLMWNEPGKMATFPTKSGEVPFFLSADGLTDQEFWQVANSLQ